MTHVEQSDARRALANPLWLFGLLGSLFTAFAFINLAHKFFDIGLTPTLQEVLDYYRSIVHPIMGWLLGWVSWLFPAWHVPEWLKDLYTLSLIGGMSIARTLIILQDDFLDADERDPASRLAAAAGSYFVGLLTGLTGMALTAYVMPFAALFVYVRNKGRTANVYQRAHRLMTLILILAFAGAVLFFALNAVAV
jgi:hypothetical protein